MTHTHYGGAVEYVTALLLVLQIAIGWGYLIRRRGDWSRALWVTVATSLAVLWAATLAALFLTWSGTVYTSRAVPVGLRAALVAAGYCWIMLSWLGIAGRTAVRSLAARIPGAYSPARRGWLRAAGVAAVVLPSAAIGYGAFVERNEYGIRELDFPVPGLHPDLDGYRIVQVSDLHVSPFLSTRQAGRVIDMANELRADLAVFTGDLISELGDPLNDAIRELIRLRAGDGVLGCMGNHEAYIGCRKYLARRAGLAGQVFLRDAATQIRRGQAILNVAGVDYQPSGARANYLAGTERLIVPGAANLLLSHNPDVFPVAVQRGFQAVLSGHTHGGQINVEILHQNINPARFRTPFISGLYRQGGSGDAPGSCFVTNGIGTIGIPIRLGAPPEIALLRLRRA